MQILQPPSTISMASTSKQCLLNFPPSSSSSSSQNLFITSKQSSNSTINNKRKSVSILMFIFLFFILLCFFLISLITLLFSKSTSLPPPTTTNSLKFAALDQEPIRIGLINVRTDEEDEIHDTLRFLGLIEESERRSRIEMVTIDFDRIEKELEWKDLFPEWIDEDEKYNKSPECPNIPMPKTEDYSDLNVVVLRIPCKRKGGIFRDVFRLQANLAAARVAVASGWVEEEVYRTVYVVFLGKCGAMREIFRCDDLVVKDDRTVEGVWVYKPEMKRLKQKIFMPFGSCQLAPVFARTGWFLVFLKRF